MAKPGTSGRIAVTLMVANGTIDSTTYLPKIQNALVSAWPKPINLYHDITRQGVAATFQRNLTSGLRTRGLMRVLEELRPLVRGVALPRATRSSWCALCVLPAWCAESSLGTGCACALGPCCVSLPACAVVCLRMLCVMLCMLCLVVRPCPCPSLHAPARCSVLRSGSAQP